MNPMSNEGTSGQFLEHFKRSLSSCEAIMLSSQRSSRSSSEETYYTAEENHSCYVPSSSPDSVYATANQTPKANPEMERGTVSSSLITAQDQGSFDALRHIQNCRNEREETSSDAAAAANGVFLIHQAEANTKFEQQKITNLRQGSLTVSEKEKGKLASPTISSAKHRLVVLWDRSFLGVLPYEITCGKTD